MQTHEATEQSQQNPSDRELTGGASLDPNPQEENAGLSATIEPASAHIAILNALSAPIALLDRLGKIWAVNNAWRAFAQNNGLLHADAGVGENYLEICDRAMGSSAGGAKQAAAGIRNVLSGQSEEYCLEYPCHSRTAQRWFRLAVTPLEGSPPKGAMVVHVDISERRFAQDAMVESEERFRATFEQAAVGLAHLGSDGHFLRVNDKLCQITGYPRSELLELSWRDLTIAEDVAAGNEALQAMLAGEKPLYVIEKRYRRKDGEIFWVNLVTTLVREPDSSPKYFISVFEDVTIRKQIEEKLWRQASRLAAIVEAQQELAETSCTHEELMNEVAKMAHRLIDSDGAVFERIEEEELILHAASGLGEEHLGTRIKIAASFSGEVVRSDRTLICDDTETDPRVDVTASKDVGARSMVVTVIRGESGPIGTIKVFSRQAARFGKSDANSLELLAQSLSAVLQRKAAEAETQTRVRQQAAVADLGRWALAGVRLSQLRDKAAEIVTEIFGIEFCELLELLPDGRSLKLVTGVGWRPGLVGRLRLGTVGDTLAGQTLLSETPLIVESLTDDERFMGGTLHHEHGVVSGISVIVQGEKGAWGILGAHSSKPRVFTRDDVNFFQSVANVIAEATHRARADEAIRLNETRYRRSSEQLAKIMDSSLDVICTFDSKGRFLQVSAACEQMWGYTAEELLGTYCNDRVFPDDLSKTQASSAAVMEGNPTRSFENRYVRKDGRVTHMTWSAHWSDVEQTMFCVARDNTDAKLAAEASQQLARRLTNTLESITDAFFTVDRHWRFTYINDEAESLLLRGRRDLLGKVLWDEFGGILGTKFETLYRRAMGENCTVSFEEFYAPLNLWVEVRGYPSDDGLTVYFRDVTERRRIVDRLEEQAALLDKARDAILVRDLDQHVTYWNKSAERLYGWTAEEAIGHHIGELTYRDTAPLLRACETVIEAGEWMGELEQVTKDGRDIIIEARWTLVRDKAGHPRSILAINTDVTDQKKMEQQFLRAQRMESIGTLAGGIAHDLNNVLTPITMAIDLLRITATDERSKQVLATIASSAKRGADMVSQVLSFARGMEGQRIWVEAKALIHDIERIARDTFPKSIEIRTVLKEPLWGLQGDSTQLHQVLLNLCVNARDAMPDGGRITLNAENIQIDAQFAATNIEAKAGPYLLIQVEDTGTGMPQSVIDKIFDPFFTTKELGKGTGLGLSTSLAIVKSHNGFVRVTSEPGKGSRFVVYLPAMLDRHGEAPQPTTGQLPRGNNETVLVVDDEPSVRDVTRQTLESFGYRVLVAVDGAEAVMLYAQHKENIAIVLTDMMMPVMGGATTVQVLMKMNPDVRIIAASGITSNEAVARAAGTAVKRFLAKPYTAETVLNALKEVLSDNG